MDRQSRAVGLLVGVLGFLAGSTTVVDNSLLTHLATGRLIWSGEGIPHADPYTFTAAGDAWVVQSWFASVLFGGLDDAVGLAGMRFLFGVVIGVTLIGCWMLTATATTLAGRVVAVAPVVAVAAYGWDQRPYVFAFAVLTLALLAADGHIDPRWLLPAGWLWVNTHGSWPLGAVAVASVWAGSRLDGAPSHTERRAGVWLLGGFAAGVLNPYGVKLLAFPATAVARRDIFTGILEWQAPTFDNTEQYAFLAVVVLAALALRRRPTWRAAVPIAVFLPLALTSARNIDVAALVLLPGIAYGLADIGATRASLRLPVLPISALGVTLAVAGVYRIGPSDDFADGPYPAEAATWLEAHDLAPTEARVIAREYVGNYFEARYGEGVAVFVDDRFEFLPREVIEDARTLMAGGPGWDAILVRYESDAVVWEADLPLAQLLDLDDDWDIGYRDDKWIVAVPA